LPVGRESDISRKFLFATTLDAGTKRPALHGYTPVGMPDS
jgi:hypothetical protein